MPKILNTKSSDIKVAGNIKTRQLSTPKAQNRLISLEDLRLTIRAISEKFHKGKIIPAKSPMIWRIGIVVGL